MSTSKAASAALDAEAAVTDEQNPRRLQAAIAHATYVAERAAAAVQGAKDKVAKYKTLLDGAKADLAEATDQLKAAEQDAQDAKAKVN